MEHWTDLDRRHVWHPYTQMQTAPPPLAVERAEGVYLYTADGRRVLDGISSWWVNTLGHSHPRLIRALSRQAERLQQVVFAGATHEAAARLAARLVQAAPRGLEHVFYSDDGSTAVEVALKLAIQHHRNRGEPERTLFAAMTNAYHGDTFGAMAAGGVPVFHESFAPFLFGVRRFHTASRTPEDPVPPASLRAGSDGSLEEVLERDGERVAAVIVEPMLQGAGGMIVWPASFLREVRALSDRHGVLLIADEVLTGFGRTGRLFACEHGPIVPDILCLSKAITGGCLPLAATLASTPVYSSFLSDDRRKTFFHGHSYTANALACAVALENLAILEEENLIERVLELESLFRRRLEKLRSHPLVADARGIGAVAAIELAPPGREGEGYLDALGPWLAARFLERGVLLRPLGNVLYFLPPYAIRDAEAEGVFDTIEAVLAACG